MMSKYLVTAAKCTVLLNCIIIDVQVETESYIQLKACRTHNKSKLGIGEKEWLV